MIFIFGFGGVGVELLRKLNVLNEPFWFNVTAQNLTIRILTAQLLIFIFFLYYRHKPLKQMISTSQTLLSVKLQRLILVATFVLIPFILYYNYEFLLSQNTTRHSGGANFQRLLLLLSLLIIIGLNFCKLMIYRINIAEILILLVIITCTIYPAATASRFAVIPVIVHAATGLSRGRRFKATIWFCISFLFLYASLASRGSPSLVNFHASYLSLDTSDIIDIVLDLIQFSFPGGSTVDAVLSTDYEYNFAFWWVPLYLSPLPSSLLSSDVLHEMSLSYPLGYDREIFSLNFDHYTEGYYWLGYPGLLVWPAIQACIIRVSESLLNSKHCRASYLLKSMATLCLFYFLLGGMVFTTRAGTRFLLYVIIIAMLLRLLQRIKFSAYK